MRQVAKITYGSGDRNIWKSHLKHGGGGGHIYLLKQTPPWILGAKQPLSEGRLLRVCAIKGFVDYEEVAHC